MCNIAGYVGSKNSTPILLEMIKKQEGLNGGFYTGIAVHNGNTIDYKKVQGDLAVLLKTTNAEGLVGNTGIVHSRTPSGGNSSWAHPFIAERNGEVKICYVANGARASFADNAETCSKIADSMIASGYDIPNKLNIQGSIYIRLSTGESVHMSDVLCQRIYEHLDSGKTPIDAMTSAYVEMPGEIVGLMLEKNSPKCIYYSRINRPMFVGFNSDGAYLASSPTAFPESVKEYKLLPALSSGVIYKDHYEVVPYKEFSKPVLPFDDSTIESSKAVIVNLLKNGTTTVKDIFHALEKILPTDTLTDRDAITYLSLTSLLNEKVITFTNGSIEKNGFVAPKIYFNLK